MVEYATVSHTRASERVESRQMQEKPTAGKKQAVRADKSIRAWSSWESISRAIKDTAIVVLSDRLESIGRGRQQGQTVECVIICHSKAYKGIRASAKQAYAGNSRPQERVSHKSR